MKKLIKNLPPTLRELAMLEQEAQINKRNDGLYVNDSSYDGSFDWAYSLQKWGFWNDIDDNFDNPVRLKELFNDLPKVLKRGLVWEEEKPTSDEVILTRLDAAIAELQAFKDLITGNKQ